MDTKFSIIVPVYNSINFLNDCILSILEQTYSNYEIILINDGSTDGSDLFCTQLAKDFTNIYVIHQKNKGLSIARNNGIKASTGEYVIFFDSDDYWVSKDFLRIAAQALEHKQNDLIIFGYKRLKVRKKSDLKLNSNDILPADLRSKKVVTKLYRNKLLVSSACNKIVRRELLINNSLFFEESRLSEDIEWSYQLFKMTNEIMIIPKKIYIYVDTQDSITSRFNRNHYSHLKLIVERLFESTNIDSTDDRFLLPYLSYQYGILLFHSLCHENNANQIKMLKDNLWIKKYEATIKMRFFYILYFFLRFNFIFKVFKNRMCKNVEE